MSRFAIRHTRSGPYDLRADLPVTGYVFDTRTDSQGNDEFFCARLDQPLKYRFAADFDTGRGQPERLGHDEHGDFLWITDVVFWSSTFGEQPYVGMRGFPVDLAYVIDATLNDDTVVDPAKIDVVGTVEIDHVDDEEGESRDDTGLRPPAPPTIAVEGPQTTPAHDSTSVVPQQTSVASRHRHPKAVLVGALAVVALVVGGAAVLLLRSSPDDQDPGTGSTTMPTTTTTEDEALRAQLLRLVPPGYPAGTCKPVPSPEGAVAAVTCEKNADPGGPLSATYILARDKAALDTAFGTFVGDSTVLVCPGNIQSPGPWRRNATPQIISGTLFCGIHDNQPTVAWTDDAKLMLSVVRSGPGGPTLDQLYGWWSSHS